MSLLETVVTVLGPAIAKTVLKLWAGDNKAISEGTDSAVGALEKLIPEIRTRNEAKRQLESIGERAAESLMFTFESEGKLLIIEDQEAVATLVARTLVASKIDAELLVEKDLDPVRLAEHFISESSSALSTLSEGRVQLFTRIVQEASQSIIDIARVLPNFTERTFSALLKQNRILVEAAQQILDRLDRIRKQPTDDQEIEAARFETEYRRAITRNLNKIELFGVELSRASKSHPLSVAYVSLDVSGRGWRDGDEPDSTAEGGGHDENSESAIDAVEAALAGTERLVIRGPAGAGKTTLVHWIAVQAASRSFEEPLESWNSAVPFLIRLRQFSDCELPRPEQFPSLVAPSISDTMPRGWVHQALVAGNAVVMVDGVDEVPESRRTELRTWLEDLVKTFPKSRFIVTSRPHAVEQGWLDHEEFLHADLQPMDMAEVETFIDHWHLAVREEVEREEEIASLGRLAKDLKITLRENLAIRRLATNPLLCSVICALHRDTNEQLPEDRLELYDRCCSMLLERRDPESGLKLRDYPKLSYRQKRALLDDLAYWMIKNDWSEIPLDSARARLHRKVETLRLDDRRELLVSGENTLRLFLERSGILREPLKGNVDFAHRTFQEFMAAHAAISEGDIGVLLTNATKSQWRELVVLGAGIARPAERAKLIKELLARGDEDRTTGAQVYLLAAACLEASVDVDSVLRTEVETRIGRLFPPRSFSDAMQIADAAGDMAVPFLKRTTRYLGSKQFAACVRALAWIGTREAVSAIAEYAYDPAITVRKEVARASDRIDPKVYLEVIGPHLDAAHLPGEAVAQLALLFGFDNGINLQNAHELALAGQSARNLNILHKFKSLRVLRLSGPAIRDLRPLSSSRHLRSLTLDRIAIDNLVVLTRLPELSHLKISRCVVDGAQIAEIRTLESLHVSGGEIRNPMELTCAPKLSRLSLYDVDVDVGFLPGMSNLRVLSTGHLDEGKFPILALMKNLESLLIIGGTVGDLRWLADLTKLTDLDLYSVEFANAAAFPQLPALRKLSVKGRPIAPKLARQIREMYPFAKFDK